MIDPRPFSRRFPQPDPVTPESYLENLLYLTFLRAEGYYLRKAREDLSGFC